MDNQAVFAATFCRGIDAVERDGLPVPAVLQRQQARDGAMLVIRLHRARDRVRVEPAIGRRLDRREHDAAEDRGAARLVDEDMIVVACQDFLATLAMRQHRAEIGLRSAADVQRRFLAKEFRRLFLKRIYRRVIAIDVVTDIGCRHGRAHALGWPGHGVASHIHSGRRFRRGIQLGASCIMHLDQSLISALIYSVPKSACEGGCQATHFAATKAFMSKAASVTASCVGDSPFSRQVLPSM